MNNEEKILAILEQMQGDIASLKQGQATLEQGQEELRVGMNAMREEMNDRFDSLESSLKMAWEDISSGGERNPAFDQLITLADYFDVSIDYLVGRTDKPEINK